MLHRLFILIQILYSSLFVYRYLAVREGEVLGARIQDGNVGVFIEQESYTKVNYTPQIVTTTAFDQREEERYEAIPYDTVYVDDEDLEYGLEEVREPGEEGVKTFTYLVTYWVDEIIDETLIDTKVESPVTEVVAEGTKVVWRELDTPEYGEIKYWYKIRVWATKYDSTCEGCNNTTALGAPVQQGVCAVDPTVISMYTHFYVPGYGRCQALDVGGAVKGNKIDLAYEDHTQGSWRTGYVDIYLMDNEP
jgi:3D (Asp-Asp-Asp) domain-containing protein